MSKDSLGVTQSGLGWRLCNLRPQKLSSVVQMYDSKTEGKWCKQNSDPGGTVLDASTAPQCGYC